MIELAREAADGMLSYLVTPARPATARGVLGPVPALRRAGDPARRRPGRGAPHRARAHELYFDLGNYPPSLRAQGFTGEDLAGQGSDRIIDGLVAWGGVDAIAGRVRQHLAAGADHVCIQPLPTGGDLFALDALRKLAPALL